MSKGSRSRPFSVTQAEYDTRWDAIFGRDVQENNMQVTENKVGTCGCGRSPTGSCIGWHGLSKEVFEQKLKDYQETTLKSIEP
jgi:hypothetical protein